VTPVPTDRFSTRKNIVALGLDDNMVYGFLVLAHRLARTPRDEVFLVVGYFPGKLSAKNVDLIGRYLSWLAVEHDIVEYSPHELFTERRHLTTTTFLKFVISDELRQPHLWLDIDTVVTSGWDSIFGAIRDAPGSAGLVVAEKIPGPDTRFEGFNAGVLGWTEKTREDWLPALASLPEKRFSSEQYLFNTLYSGKTSSVGSEFNFLSSWHRNFDPENMAQIIHYSGPLKPWHLHRFHASRWTKINPTWSVWFQAEREMMTDIKGQGFASTVAMHCRRALFSGRLHTGKGSAASWVLRVLAILGPLGAPLTWLLVTRAKT
jgi:hypothetical protein